MPFFLNHKLMLNISELATNIINIGSFLLRTGIYYKVTFINIKNNKE